MLTKENKEKIQDFLDKVWDNHKGDKLFFWKYKEIPNLIIDIDEQPDGNITLLLQSGDIINIEACLNFYKNDFNITFNNMKVFNIKEEKIAWNNLKSIKYYNEI